MTVSLQFSHDEDIEIYKQEIMERLEEAGGQRDQDDLIEEFACEYQGRMLSALGSLVGEGVMVYEPEQGYRLTTQVNVEELDEDERRVVSLISRPDEEGQLTPYLEPETLHNRVSETAERHTLQAARELALRDDISVFGGLRIKNANSDYLE